MIVHVLRGASVYRRALFMLYYLKYLDIEEHYGFII